MSVSYAPVDLDDRLVFFRGAPFQAVTDAEGGGALQGALHGIALLDDRPLLVQEQLGTGDGGDPGQAVGDAEGLPERDAHDAVDARKIVTARRNDTGAAHVAGAQVGGRAIRPGGDDFAGIYRVMGI